MLTLALSALCCSAIVVLWQGLPWLARRLRQVQRKTLTQACPSQFLNTPRRSLETCLIVHTLVCLIYSALLLLRSSSPHSGAAASVGFGVVFVDGVVLIARAFLRCPSSCSPSKWKGYRPLEALAAVGMVGWPLGLVFLEGGSSSSPTGEEGGVVVGAAYFVGVVVWGLVGATLLGHLRPVVGTLITARVFHAGLTACLAVAGCGVVELPEAAQRCNSFRRTPSLSFAFSSRLPPQRISRLSRFCSSKLRKRDTAANPKPWNARWTPGVALCVFVVEP